MSLIGLHNLGNTCYLNTTLQCLLSTRFLSDYIRQLQSANQSDESVMVACYQKLIEEIQRHPDGGIILNPEVFVRVSSMLSMKLHQEKGRDVFVFGQQHDMVEYLQYLFDCFHQALSYKVTMHIEGNPSTNIDRLMIHSLQIWEQFFAKEYSIIVEHFTGQYLSVTHTVGQSNFHEVFDPFSILTLPIPSGITPTRPVTLHDCFQLFVTPEEIVINQERKMKTMFLWKLPQVLIIHLKRFHDRMRKVDTPVEIPFHLDVSPYCQGYGFRSQYELYAVGNHSGGLSGGHYYAACKHQHRWHLYNDSSVTEITPDAVITPNAYCLFYQRK